MSVNFNNIQNPYLNTAQNENFGAMTPEAQAKLQKVEATAKDVTNDSFVGTFLNGLGVDTKNPKKAILSILGAVMIAFGLRAGFSKIIKNDGLVKVTNGIGEFFKKQGFIQNIGNGLKKATADGTKLGNVKKFFAEAADKFKKSKLMTGKNGPRLAMVKTQLKGTWGEIIDTITDFFRTKLKNQELDDILRKLIKDPSAVSRDAVESALKNANKTGFASKQQRAILQNAISEISKRTSLDKTSVETIKTILKNSSGTADEGLVALVNFIKNPSKISIKELTEILQDGTKTKALNSVDKDTILNLLNGIKPTRKNSQKELMDIVGVLRQTQKVNKDALTKTLKKLLGEDVDVSEFVEGVKRLSKDDTLKFEEFKKLYDALLEKNGLDPKNVDTKGLLKLLSPDGNIASITGKTEGGFIMRQNVNLAEALKKFAIINGDTADNALARFLQKGALRGAEGISNGVASKTLFGSLLALNIYNGVFNKTQDAPKGEKVATFAEEAVTDMGNYMMLPLAGSIVYKLGNLKEYTALAGDGIFTRGVKWIGRQAGKLFSMGLSDNSGKFAKVFGGAGRAIGVLLIVAPFLMKPIMKLSRALFGKTTEVKKQEEEALKKKQEKNNPPQQPVQIPEGAPTNYLDMIDQYYKIQQQTANNNGLPATNAANTAALPAAAAPTLPANKEIPAKKINDDKNGQNNQIDDPNRSYIPSPVQTLTKATAQNYKQSALDVALQQAANAEKLAEKFI